MFLLKLAFYNFHFLLILLHVSTLTLSSSLKHLLATFFCARCLLVCVHKCGFYLREFSSRKRSLVAMSALLKAAHNCMSLEGEKSYIIFFQIRGLNFCVKSIALRICHFVSSMKLNIAFINLKVLHAQDF